MKPVPPLTTCEAAKIIGVSATRVRQLAKKDRIRHVKVGQIYIFDRRDIDAFIALGERKPGRPSMSR